MYKIIDWLDYFFSGIEKKIHKTCEWCLNLLQDNLKEFMNAIIAGLVLCLFTTLGLMTNIPVLTAIILGLAMYIIHKMNCQTFTTISLDFWRDEATFPQVILILIGNLIGIMWMGMVLYFTGLIYTMPLISFNPIFLLTKGFIYGFIISLVKDLNGFFERISFSTIGMYFGYSSIVLLSAGINSIVPIILVFIGNFLGVGCIAWWKRSIENIPDPNIKTFTMTAKNGKVNKCFMDSFVAPCDDILLYDYKDKKDSE